MTNYSWLAYLGFSLLGFVLVVGAGPALFAEAEHVIRGEVVMISSDVCVVKDETGTTTMLRVDPSTKMDGSVKEGAKVEVTVSSEHLALSIKVLSEKQAD